MVVMSVAVLTRLFMLVHVAGAVGLDIVMMKAEEPPLPSSSKPLPKASWSWEMLDPLKASPTRISPPRLFASASNRTSMPFAPLNIGATE